MDFDSQQLLLSVDLETTAKPLTKISTEWAQVTRGSSTPNISGGLSLYVGQPDVLLHFLCSDDDHREAWARALENLIDESERQKREDKRKQARRQGATEAEIREAEAAEANAPRELLFTFEGAQLGLKLANEEDYCRVSGFSTPDAPSQLMGLFGLH